MEPEGTVFDDAGNLLALPKLWTRGLRLNWFRLCRFTTTGLRRILLPHLPSSLLRQCYSLRRSDIQAEVTGTLDPLKFLHNDTRRVKDNF